MNRIVPRLVLVCAAATPARALPIRLFANSFRDIGRETSQCDSFHNSSCAAILQHNAP